MLIISCTGNETANCSIRCRTCSHVGSDSIVMRALEPALFITEDSLWRRSWAKYCNNDSRTEDCALYTRVLPYMQRTHGRCFEYLVLCQCCFARGTFLCLRKAFFCAKVLRSQMVFECVMKNCPKCSKATRRHRVEFCDQRGRKNPTMCSMFTTFRRLLFTVCTSFNLLFAEEVSNT